MLLNLGPVAQHSVTPPPGLFAGGAPFLEEWRGSKKCKARAEMVKQELVALAQDPLEARAILEKLQLKS